jgi:hypothetical protein
MAIKTFAVGEVLTASDTNTYLANSGLVYVGSITFTGQTGANLDSVFTGTYRNYLIVADLTTSAAETVIYQLRAGGVTNTGLNVQAVQQYFQWGTAGAFYNQLTNQNYAYFGYGNTNGFGTAMWVYGPQLAKYTYTQLQGSAITFPSNSVARHDVNTQYDGIRIASFGTATITGSVTVYGHRIV